MKVSIGIDVGGSHVGIGFLDMDGVLLLKSDVKINGMVLLSDQLVHAIVNLIQKNCNSTWEISSIGVGCPGQAKNGVIVAASNIPLIRNMPLVDILSQIYKGIPIVLLNDADAALAAEMWGFHKDAYANIKNAALITLGTGIGCGLMIDGKLYHGSNGLIEAGHMIVSDDPRRTRKCGCGQSGCVEVYASATNTAKRFLELNKESAEIVIAGDVKASEEAHAEGGTTEVFDRYFKHDTKAVKVVEETAEHLATLCINLCRVIDPEIIVFGGGMANVGQPLLDLINKHISKKAWTVLPTYAKLSIAKSGSDNGIIGAALAAAQLHSIPMTTVAAMTASTKQPSSADTKPNNMVSTAITHSTASTTQPSVQAPSDSGSLCRTYGRLLLATANVAVAAFLLNHTVQQSVVPHVNTRSLLNFLSEKELRNPAKVTMLFLSGQLLVSTGFVLSYLLTSGKGNTE